MYSGNHKTSTNNIILCNGIQNETYWHNKIQFVIPKMVFIQKKTHGLLYEANPFSSLAPTVWDRQYFEDSEQKDHQLNELINELFMKVFVEQPRLHRVY